MYVLHCMCLVYTVGICFNCQCLSNPLCVLPTVVRSMLSRKRATKTIKRMSRRDERHLASMSDHPQSKLAKYECNIFVVVVCRQVYDDRDVTPGSCQHRRHYVVLLRSFVNGGLLGYCVVLLRLFGIFAVCLHRM